MSLYGAPSISNVIPFLKLAVERKCAVLDRLLYGDRGRSPEFRIKGMPACMKAHEIDRAAR
jgi:hypothetical protein